MSGTRPAAAAAALALFLPAAPLTAGEVPGAIIELLAPPGTPGSEPAGAPPRFVLLKDGQVFVGGTSAVETARLDKRELQSLRKQAEAIRKALGRTARVGPAEAAMRLRLLWDQPVEIGIAGDPAAAQPAPLAGFVTALLHYDPPDLAPYAPASYALAAREAQLVGGCRPWTFAFPIEQATSAPIAVPAGQAVGWPTGAFPASVCAGERHYVVTLRPLLPGETP